MLDRGVVNPVGLFDLARQPHPVAYAFRKLMQEFSGLPAYGEGMEMYSFGPEQPSDSGPPP